MKKSVFFTKDINYGASTGSSTKNTALTPDQLADGALGLYAISPSTQKLVLVVDNDSGTGKIDAAANAVEDFVAYVGTADGPKKSGVFKLGDIVVRGSNAVAAVKQVLSVGYKREALTGTAGQAGAGSLNLPATILKGDDGMFKVIEKNDPNKLSRSGDTYSGTALVNSASEYSILKNLFDHVMENEGRVVNMEIVGKGTITEFTADATFTNGSKTLTFGGNQTVAAGALVSIYGAIYEVEVGVTAGTSLTLDREFQGATVTIDVDMTVNFAGTIASITETGFELTDRYDDQAIDLALLGIFSSASTSVITAAVKGNGTTANMVAKEKESWDRHDRIDRRLPLPNSYVDTTIMYDQYILKSNNSISNQDGTGAAKHGEHLLTIGFPSTVANTAGKNQSDFEDVLVGLAIPFTTLF